MDITTQRYARSLIGKIIDMNEALANNTGLTRENLTKQHTTGISKLVLQIESVCNQACTELKEEYNLIKTSNDERQK